MFSSIVVFIFVQSLSPIKSNQGSDSILEVIDTNKIARIIAERQENASREEKRYLLQNDIDETYVPQETDDYEYKRLEEQDYSSTPENDKLKTQSIYLGHINSLNEQTYSLDGQTNNLDNRKNNLDGMKNSLGQTDSLDEQKNNLGQTNSLNGRKNSLDSRKHNLDGQTSSLDSQTSSLDSQTSSLDSQTSSFDGQTSNLDDKKNSLDDQIEIFHHQPATFRHQAANLHQPIEDFHNKLVNSHHQTIPHNQIDKILKSSRKALLITKKEYLQRDWCKSEPLVQKIREEGCLTRTVINRFCYGQCNSFFIPKNPRKRHSKRKTLTESEDEDLNGAAFKSCSFCRPKRFSWMTISLKCPSMIPPYKTKRIQRVKQCSCVSRSED